MIVGGALALFEQLADLRQREKGQLYLIRLDLTDIGERVLSYPGPEPDQFREHGRQVALLMVDRMRRRHFQALLPIPRPGQCVEGRGERIAEPFGDRQRSRQTCLLVFERAAVQLMPEVHQIR